MQLRKGLIISLLFIAIAHLSYSQNSFKFGILGGISAYNVNPTSVSVENEDGGIIGKLGFKDADYGMHFGIFALAKSSFLFIKPQVQFNSQTVNYTYNQVSNGDIRVFKETYQDIDIPIQLGVNLGPLRLGMGPVGHIHLDGKSDFYNFKEIDYAQEFKEMSFGYILGIGLDIWSFHIDAGYEGNFSHLGDHIILYGKKIAFDSTPSRFVFTLGVSF